ncbi:DHH family phosphoesterase [Candidatus Uhrbacteria bacterium]|nr:DHH family phosphoesterase [Candidatus Uhrbacteria bacterium]
MHETLAQQITAKLTSGRKILLTVHRRPDPDALGSAAAMATYLKAQGIDADFFSPTPLPPEAAFFGIYKSVTLAQVKQYDLLCTFDTGDLKHAGLDGVWGANNESRANLRISNSQIRKFGFHSQLAPPFLINFDHHATNTRFGNLNVVDITAASTTEVLYHFFKAVNWTISVPALTYLLAGLLVDTDHFFNPATTASSLKMTAELLSQGVPFQAVRSFLFERRKIGTLKLIGTVLARLQKHPRLPIAATYLTDEDIERFNLSADEIEGIANLLNTVGDAKAMLVIKASAGVLRGSFRTTREDVDVGKLAVYFGGGGHRKAAGFTISGALTFEDGHVKIK